MAENKIPPNDIDWSLATWEGARREAMRRWAQLPLEHIVAALEDMEQLNAALSDHSTHINEPTTRYNVALDNSENK